MAQKDIALRELEKHEDVFADIVQIFLLKNRLKIHTGELLDMRRESGFVGDDDHLTEQNRDLIKRWQINDNRAVLIGIENQSKIDYGMSLRIQGYDGLSYKTQYSQIVAQNRYYSSTDKAFPVITLVLYTGFTQKWPKRKHLSDNLNIHPSIRPYITDTRLFVRDLAWLSLKVIRSFKSDFKYVLKMLRQLRLKGTYRPRKTDILKHPYDFFLVWRAFVNDSKISDYITPSLKSKKDFTMCEYLDSIEKKGKKDGIMQRTQEVSLIFNYLKSIGKIETLGDILNSTRKFNAMLRKAQTCSIES